MATIARKKNTRSKFTATEGTKQAPPTGTKKATYELSRHNQITPGRIYHIGSTRTGITIRLDAPRDFTANKQIGGINIGTLQKNGKKFQIIKKPYEVTDPRPHYDQVIKNGHKDTPTSNPT